VVDLGMLQVGQKYPKNTHHPKDLLWYGIGRIQVAHMVVIEY